MYAAWYGREAHGTGYLPKGVYYAPKEKEERKG
jgi:hypothetical protein